MIDKAVAKHGGAAVAKKVAERDLDGALTATSEVASKRLQAKRKDVRRTQGPRKPATTPLDGALVLVELQSFDRKLDAVSDLIERELHGEELEAVNEYLESIEVKLGVIKAKVNGTIDWGTLTKKEG